MLDRSTRRGAAGVAVTVALALTVAACGSPGTSSGGGAAATGSSDVIDDLNGLSAGEQRDEAVKQAKEEGELDLYTGASEGTANALSEAFTEQFGIKVNVFRASSEDVLQRVLQESSANRLGADALFLSQATISSVADEDLLAGYEGSAADDLGADAQHDGWTTASGYLYLPVWNTDRITEGNEPTSWEDLADPRFDGQLTLEASDSDWFGALSTYWADQGKSQEEIDGLWADIVDGASVASGHSTMVQLLGAGQTGVNAMNYDYIAAGAQDDGAPVAYQQADGSVPTPAFVYPFGVGALGQAEHPAAAWLFADWLLDEGQDVLADRHLLSAAVAAGDEAPPGVTTIPFPTSVDEDSKDWADRYDALLRGVPVTGD